MTSEKLVLLECGNFLWILANQQNQDIAHGSHQQISCGFQDGSLHEPDGENNYTTTGYQQDSRQRSQQKAVC